MIWFDLLFLFILIIFCGISLFCWIFTIVTLFRKKD